MSIQRASVSGRPPAIHVPVMMDEVVRGLRPRPGDVVVDCTLGAGGHARALLERLRPDGRLLGLDLDSLELPQTEARLRALGFGPDILTVRHGNFRTLPRLLAAEGIAAADIVFADLGVSAMQLDNPRRGFGYKSVAPLDMRMDPAGGTPASALLADLSEPALCAALDENADEPDAAIIARLLNQQPLDTTHLMERVVRIGLASARPELSNAQIKDSIRRTFQAVRMAVNDETAALEEWLAAVPRCLAPGGRVAVITFHAGEDRRVARAFDEGARAGVYADVSAAIRPSRAEIRANRRSSSARLRWAVRALR